jgi:hypothetical protein
VIVLVLVAFALGVLIFFVVLRDGGDPTSAGSTAAALAALIPPGVV